MVSPWICPHSASLNRITPVVEFLNKDAEGKGEALIFKTNNFGIHKKTEHKKLPAPRFVSRHYCFVPLCCCFLLHIPGAAGGRRGHFTHVAPHKALLLPELLVFTFQNVKNSAGLPPALTPSKTLRGFRAQRGSWATCLPETQAKPVLSSEDVAFPEATSVSYLCGVLECRRSSWTSENLVVMDVFPS